MTARARESLSATAHRPGGSRRPAARRLAFALVAAAAVFLGVAVGSRLIGRPPAPAVAKPARAELDRLRLQYRELEDELEDLRQLVADTQPMVGLGGSEKVDYLIDLRELSPARVDAGVRARAVPVRFE